jgi:NAD(P)H-flavin reductase
MKKAAQHDPMVPHLARLARVEELAPEIKLFSVALLDESNGFRAYRPGQFAFISAFGVGEAPFGIASTPGRGPLLEFAVQRLGSVTNRMHELGEGDVVGVRGPLGNAFPMEALQGKDLIVLGGGIGGAPLRPVLQTVMDNRWQYGELTILWAARHPSLLIFRDEYETWRTMPDTELHLTVDEPDESWSGNVGLITDLLERVSPSPQNAVAIMCGPPIMIYHADRVLADLGFEPEQRYATLEARMHCGIGKCGRCNLGSRLICTDGPVFSMAEAGALLESYL